MLAEGRNRESIDALRLLIEKNSNHVNGHVTLARALIQKQENPDKNNPDTIEALALLDTATSLNPNDPIPLIEKQMWFQFQIERGSYLLSHMINE